MKELTIESSKTHNFSVENIEWIAVIIFIRSLCIIHFFSFNIMHSIFNAVTTFLGRLKYCCYQFVKGKNLAFGYSHLNLCLWEGGKVFHIYKHRFIKMCGRLTVKIDTFSTRWRRVVCFMFWALNPQKRALCIHQRGGWVSPSTSLDALKNRSPYPNDLKSVLVLQFKTSLFIQLLYSSSQNWCFIIPKYSIVAIFCAYYLVCSISMHIFRWLQPFGMSLNFTLSHLYGTFEPLDGFPWNLMFENVWKIIKLVSFYSDQMFIITTLYEDQCVFLCIS
jgi:hypothetical protein